jgi:hypothetical protein
MRSRSTLEWAGIALGALAQGVWCGVLGSVLSAARWPALAGFAAAAMVAAAAAARWGMGGGDRLRRGRALLAAVVLVSACVLLVSGRAWSHPYVGWQIVRGVLFCAGLVLLGVWFARGDSGPDEAFGRAARAFGALCAVLAVCALTATPVQAPAVAVAAVVVAGGLHVAVLRYRVLTDIVSEGDRLPAWPWLAAVTAAIVAVLLVTGLAAELLGGGALHAAFSGILTVFAYAFSGAAWAVAEVMRAVAWLGGLVHLHVPHAELHKLPREAGQLKKTQGSPSGFSAAGRIIAMTVLTGAAIAVAVGIVVFALRRLSRRLGDDEGVVEERETVRSVTAATGEVLGGLRRRLRTLLRVRRKAETPAEAIRIHYERLEERLTRAGSPRAPGVTVRAYLGVSVSSDQPEAPAELAALYELARYSAREVEETQAREFGDLARACRPVGPGPASGS